jgi:predicted nucleic acid-binding protein
MKLIYSDTNIWTYLAKLPVDEKKLLESLAAKDARLVLSAHVVYELARTFTGRSGPTVGVQIFSSMKRFLDVGIACSIEVKQMVIRECHSLENDLPVIKSLLELSECEIVKVEVGKLAEGVVEGAVKEYIEKRTKEAAESRADQRNHFIEKEALRKKLKSILLSDLPTWLQAETMSPYGVEVLYQHLKQMLGEGPTMEYAKAVLQSPGAHASRGLVRSNLYSNWRAANRGSNPADLLDDVLHVLQAIYCEIYATGEAKQAEYASLILTPNTTVAIYDQSVPVDQWLLSLV